MLVPLSYHWLIHQNLKRFNPPMLQTALRVKRLTEWLAPLRVPDITFMGVTEDSRSVLPGQVYVLYQHQNPNYIKQAIEQGAVALLSACAVDAPIPVIVLPELAQLRLGLYQKLYGTAHLSFPVIGVTGTNGKSSVVHFLSQLLQASYEHIGVLGTVGNGLVSATKRDQLTRSALTTQGLLLMQQWLNAFEQVKAQVGVFEVSSHAIDQGRIQGLDFSVKVLTNVTQEHLDYHGSFDAYQSVKRSFFEFDQKTIFVVNLDDDLGQQLAGQCELEHQPYYGYSLINPQAHFYAKDICSTAQGYAFQLNAMNQTHRLQFNLKGRFQLANVLASLATVQALTGAVPFSLIPQLTAASGRLERIKVDGDIEVYVDFAHTPDALQSVLETLREKLAGRLICLFGCGGDRDSDKRAQMGRISERLADITIITDDNPRTEAPDQIRAQILQGAPNALVIAARASAIYHAIEMAEAGDLVLIAGKGHETEQIIGTKRFEFSDQATAKDALLMRYA